MKMNNIDIAVNYLIKNKLVPIPCMGEGDSKGKIPLIKWQQVQQLPTPDQVRDIFRKFPDCNIGFKTGKVSGILVLDNDGVQIKEPMPLTPTATSRSGHFHSYFKNPDFYVPPSASKIGEHLDIRCDQAFIVAPPSKHFDKITGEIDGEYTWVDGMSPDDIPFAPCPEWLINRLKETISNTHGFDWSGALNVGTGARDDTLKSAAASLVAKKFEYDTALAILRGINSTYKPPLEDSVVVNKLKTAIEFIESQRTKESPIHSNSFLSSVPKLITELTENQSKVDWIWEGYLAKGHLTFFSALWKVGKSTLISYLLKSLNENKEFAGLPVTPSKVLILSEESETIWARRREDLDLTGDIYLHCRPTKIKLDNKQWLTLLDINAKFCVEKGIELLIIDTISTFWPVREEGNNPEIDAALIPLNTFFEKGISVMIVHHFRKSGGDQGTATRGGGGIGSRADILVEYTRLEAQNPNGTQRVLRSYSRFEETPPELVIDLIDGQFVPKGTRSEVSKEARLRVVISILEDQADLTIQEIHNAWDVETSGNRPVVRTIRNYIDILLKDGRVEQTGKKLVGKTEAPSYSLVKETQERNDTSPIDNSNEQTKLGSSDNHLYNNAKEIFGVTSVPEVSGGST